MDTSRFIAIFMTFSLLARTPCFADWNQGYALLSEIIARTSGNSYTEYIRENICQRCGMNASGFTGDLPTPGDSVAIGISSHGAPRSAYDHPYGSCGLQYRGMEGLVTNVHDLWRWDRALHERELIHDDSLEEMTKAGKEDYGLGWFIAHDPDGEPCHRHGGSVRRFLSEVRLYPSIDGAVFALTNREDAIPLSTVTTGVERLLFAKTAVSEYPQAPTMRFINRVAGEYRDARNRRLRIEKSGGLPRFNIYWGGPVTSGYLGLDDADQPHLWLAIPSQRGIQFKSDTPLEFAGDESSAAAVTLLGLNPNLKSLRSKTQPTTNPPQAIQD